MRIVLTGAGGGLGGAFLAAMADADHEVRAYTHAELDIAEGDVLADGPVDLIVNAAAYTNVDACEDPANAEAATAANTLGPLRLARAAEASGATLVHVSTDYVFAGDKGAPYDERDETSPINRYGWMKLESERHVRETTDRHIIVRTAYVFGGGTDFLTKTLRRLAAGERVGALVDRVGSPTYVRHLAERLVPLALTERFGTYHLAGPEPTTWHEVFLRAKRLAPARLTGEVVEQHEIELDLPAPRPPNSALASVLLPDLAGDVPPMPPLDEALEQLIASI